MTGLLASHWNATAIHAELLLIGQKVATYAGKADQVVHFLATNPDAIKVEGMVEKAIPGATRIIASLGGVDKAFQMAGNIVPGINYAFAAYNLYESLGGHPMPFGAPIAEQDEGERAIQAGWDERQGNG